MYNIDEKLKITIQTLKANIAEAYADICDITYAPCEYKENSKLRSDLEFKKYESGTVMQGKDTHYWFHFNINTPKKIEGKQILFTLNSSPDKGWDATNPQSIVYLNGKTVQGTDLNHKEVLLEFDKSYDVYIYFYLGMLETPISIAPKVVLNDLAIEKLYYHMMVAYEAMKCKNDDSDAYIEIKKYLELTANLIDFRVIKSADFYSSVEAATKFIEEEFYGKVCGGNGAEVSCIGHTHIDVAWRWTVAQTKEKAQRSFATALNLMKQYPEYKFMSSQPQLYQYVKEADPELYEEIKRAVKEGRWEVEGAMWLECDCNLVNGESLIRQIMLGKRFFKEEFNKDSKILWLPDVFGYSAALPQILKKCGIDKFVTSKISWNDTNMMPYDSFMWEGVDGTEIFTYFLTTQDGNDWEKPKNYTTYTGNLCPAQIYGTWKRYQQKELNNATITTFGYGDGGGGSTKDMLEQYKRLRYGLPGIPAAKIEFAGEFLDRVYKNFEESCKRIKRMPKWVGELYLEFHRGTYTSMARNKKFNRKSEILYQSAEALSVADMIMLDGVYPYVEFDKNWRSILLLQFHDIIPGSSILEVYEDSDKLYDEIILAGNNIFEEKIRKIADSVKTDGGVFVYNPNCFTASGEAFVDGKAVFAEDIPPFGYKIIEAKDNAECLRAENNILENRFFKIIFSENCGIESIFDKRYNREIIKKGMIGNRLEAYEDMPLDYYDAWEIGEYYKSKMWTVSDAVACETVNEGIKAGMKVTFKFLDSFIYQTVYLYDDIARIDFDTTIDWKQEHILLKTAFPFDIHANEAAYEIQFGHIKRPTHQNTSWDSAKFEVCGHKWADIGDGDYGVSILNDCKYGYNAEGSVLKLTLLKSATYPNPKADKEVHKFKYSLYPHKGNFKDAGTVKKAYLFNNPLTALKVNKQEGKLPEEFSLLSCDCENIIIETIKRAEASNDIIVRFYEAHDKRTSASLKFGFDFKKAYLCDMLENNIEELQAENNTLAISVSNFEIVTLKIEL